MPGVLNLLLGTGGPPGVINGSIPAGSETSYTFSNDGTYTISGGAFTGNWVTPATLTIAAFYQIKVDITDGGTFDGSNPGTGSWLDLSTTRTWSRASPGTVTFTVSFREKASGIVRSIQTGKQIAFPV